MLPEPQVEVAIIQPFPNLSHDLETHAVLLEQRGKFQEVAAAQKRGEEFVLHPVTEPVELPASFLIVGGAFAGWPVLVQRQPLALGGTKGSTRNRRLDNSNAVAARPAKSARLKTKSVSAHPVR